MAVYDNANFGKTATNLPESDSYSCRVRIEKGKTYSNFIFKPQLEVGGTATEYEPHTATTHTPGSDGVVSGMTSLSLSMTILSDTDGAIVECEYIRDTNKVIEGVDDRVSKRLVDELLEDDSPIFETQMNAFLEKMVVKYLHPVDDFFSLTDIAKRYDEENPSYLIQSWLRSRNTIAFLGEWERHNNPDFDEKAFERLLIDARSPSYTLTPKKWINSVNAIGMNSKRGKNGGTEAHPFIACDFEMWLDTEFRYEVLKYFMSSAQGETFLNFSKTP